MKHMTQIGLIFGHHLSTLVHHEKGVRSQMIELQTLK